MTRERLFEGLSPDCSKSSRTDHLPMHRKEGSGEISGSDRCKSVWLHTESHPKVASPSPQAFLITQASWNHEVYIGLTLPSGRLDERVASPRGKEARPARKLRE